MFHDFLKTQRHGLGSEVVKYLFQRVHWGQVQGKVTVFLIDTSPTNLGNVRKIIWFLFLRIIAGSDTVGVRGSGTGYSNLINLLRRYLTGRDTVGLRHVDLLMSASSIILDETQSLIPESLNLLGTAEAGIH
jgi:hypothetical protein